MDVISENHQSESHLPIKNLSSQTKQAQETIYQFLLELVRTKKTTDVLREFKNLFIDYDCYTSNVAAFQALSTIISANDEQDFHYTLKRSCYILVNNLETVRKYHVIQELVELFSDSKLKKKALSQTLIRHKTWIANFIDSASYHELKLFTTRYDGSSKDHWSHRYASYLLVSQYTNTNNPLEQREAARRRSQKLKDNFKLNLAMYTAHAKSNAPQQQLPPNPTDFGDEVLRFVKRIVAKQGPFSYANVAHIFIEQTKDLSYRCFKHSLQKYLICSVSNQELVKTFNKQLLNKLDKLYENYHDRQLNKCLLLRTCNRVIHYLTVEEQSEPSGLFILLMSQGHALTLVILLLKIVLICPNSRVHLETCIARLIQYYTQFPSDKCQWAINFFEVFHITFAIHADNVKYNLISMNKQKTNDPSAVTLDSYRVFSQLLS
ncbi:MAG: hypothetical protein F6K36_14955 [Symploca sp. SIO3C6]|uniref:Uncharacterized protein n=1 Tax=Symploca sp. SIO1C4 TaxID=2607765 RepID=A0A6B3NNH8_9CYAN|nr:hypothetical protein [Symploca sp. SIO3C6]NER31101.1 hypothetical protein [Symploca sp. SIO1C4]NET07701.1 hypothetical protein [Symploca sp. SIO2B6]